MNWVRDLCSYSMRHNIKEFNILKAFRIFIKLGIAPSVIPAFYFSPPCHLLKFNIDGASDGVCSTINLLLFSDVLHVILV